MVDLDSDLRLYRRAEPGGCAKFPWPASRVRLAELLFAQGRSGLSPRHLLRGLQDSAGDHAGQAHYNLGSSPALGATSLAKRYRTLPA